MTAVGISRKQVLERDGYLSINAMASAADVAMIRGCLQRLWQDRAGFEEGALFDFVGAEEGSVISFPQILRPSDMAAELTKTRFFRDAEALARELLGPTVRFAADHALIKPAMTGPVTPWHQDDAFRDPSMDGDEVSIWLALQPTDAQNGCMAFVPGSHNGDVLPHRSPDGDSRVHALECFTGFSAADAVACPLPAGGCTVHTSRTLHYAGPNVSGDHRMAYVLVFDTPPTVAAVPRAAPWLAARRTARDAREKGWLRRGGIVVHVWRRVRRLDLRRPGHLRFLVRRVGMAVGKLAGHRSR